MKGSIFRRCSRCNRRMRRRRCEECGYEKVTWGFVVDVGGKSNGRRQLRRGGFPTRQAAEEALAELLGQKNRTGHIPVKNLTVGDYLTDRWLSRLQVRAPALDDYRTHVGAYVVPHIGDLALSEVTGDDLTELYDELLIRGRTQRPHPELG